MYKLLALLLFGFSLSLLGQDTKGSQGTMKAWYQCLDANEISDDSTKNGKLYFVFNTEVSPDSSQKEKFTWLTDYPDAYFTAYLINYTDSLISIERQDGSLMMIQEAINKKGEWEAIEHWRFSWCGNSYFNPLEIAPDQSVLVPIKKYDGDYKTNVRLKLKMGDQYFYSDSFEAKISKTQFRSFDNVAENETFIGNMNYFDELGE